MVIFPGHLQNTSYYIINLMLESKKILIITIIILLYSGGLYAQSAALSVGGNAMGLSGTVSYSIGQTVYKNYSHENLAIIEGVQQPYEIYTIPKPDGSKENIQLIVYPNPSTNHVILCISNYDKRHLSYQFYNSLGQLLSTDLIVDQETIINTDDLSPATYFLIVTENKSIIKTFKLLKK